MSKRVELDQQDVNGKTALMIGNFLFHTNSMNMSFVFQASKKNQQIIVENLLNAGANPNIMNNKGDTALSWGKIHFFVFYEYESKQEHLLVLNF